MKAIKLIQFTWILRRLYGRLLTKLKGYVFDGTLLKWIEDFLCERSQRVILNGEELE